MALKAKYQTSDFVFTGNPIIIASDYTPEDKSQRSTFIVNYEGKEIYKGVFSPPLDIDIRDVADSACGFFDEPKGNQTFELIELVMPGAYSAKRKLTAEIVYDDGKREDFEMYALPGGIPNRQYKVYAREGKDVFDSRFLAEGNFFFTTRTSGWRIEIKETELYPLYFISRGQSMRIQIMDPLSEDASFYEVPGGICTLDIDKVRRQFCDDVSRLINVFDIYVEIGSNMEFACQIVITAADSARERYRVKFRNSLGVFEILELTGKMTESNEFGDTEDSSYREMDPVTRSFVNRQSRPSSEKILSITSEVPRSKAFLVDMIKSEEVYLLDAFAEPVRVNVSAEELNMQHVSEEPEKIALQFRLTDPEMLEGDFISGADSSRKPRVHSKQFSKEFN